MESSLGWSCEHCTYSNSGFSLECECCLRPRPSLANRDLSTTAMILGGVMGAISGGMKRGRVSDVLRGATNGAVMGSIAGNLVELTAGYLARSSAWGEGSASARAQPQSSVPAGMRVPASSAAINTLPTETITAASKAQSCPVCLEAFEEGDTARRLPCLHLFHRKCIDTWLKNFR